MPRREDQFQLRTAEANSARIRQINLRLWRQLIPETHAWRVCWHSIQYPLLADVELWFKAILVEYEFVAQYVVYMAMRVQQQHRFKLVIADEVNHRVLLYGGVHARVNNGALQAVIIQNDGVFLVRVVGEYFKHAQKYKIKPLSRPPNAPDFSQYRTMEHMKQLVHLAQFRPQKAPKNTKKGGYYIQF